RAARPEVEVGLHEQDLRPVSLEAHETGLAELAAVEAEVVVADTRREPVDVEEVLTQAADLEPQPILALVVVEGKEAGLLLHPLRRLRDRLVVVASVLPRFACKKAGDEEHHNSKEQAVHGSSGIRSKVAGTLRVPWLSMRTARGACLLLCPGTRSVP